MTFFNLRGQPPYTECAVVGGQIACFFFLGGGVLRLRTWLSMARQKQFLHRFFCTGLVRQASGVGRRGVVRGPPKNRVVVKREPGGVAGPQNDPILT